ncbi:MAG: class I SAM-dependent methyltransferase [Planctomycetota bacterium]
MLEVTVEDFARSFGTSADDIDERSREIISGADFRYRVLEGKERNDVILDALKKIETDTQKIGAQERQEAWQRGWAENLQAFIESGHDLDTLTPKFIRANKPIRFNGSYILPSNPMFELDYFRVFRWWLFKKYLKDVSSIYEFGCGTGFNLVELAGLFPEKKLYGLDFVPAACDLVNKLAERYNWNMTGILFDMISPDETLQLDENSAVFTSGSIEQLSGRFEAFLQFLLKRSPALCVHVEPTIELYDEDNLVDYLAVRFHRKRGYTEGYLPRLEQLQSEGRIELLKVKRLYFGSLFMEGFTCIVWRPLS